MGWAHNGHLLVARWHVVLGLKEAQQLILVVRVLRNDLHEVNVSLNNLNEEVVAHLKSAAELGLLVIQRPDPGLKERPLDAQVPAAITHLLHVATENDPRTQAHLDGEFPELLVVHNPAQNAGQEALALARVALRQIRGHAQAEYAIPQELQLLIVV